MTAIARYIPESAVAGTVGWEGDEMSDYAVLMTNENGEDVWLRSADTGYMPAKRVARIVPDVSVPAGVAGTTGSYAIAVADPMSETHLVFPDGSYVTFRDEASAVDYYVTNARA